MNTLGVFVLNMLILAGLTLAALYAVAIGANDMANVVAALIGGGVTSYKIAIIVFAISVILGSLLQGYMVMKTLGMGIFSELDTIGAISASLAAFTWVLLASALGLPVSTSQSITSGVLGVGLLYVLRTGDYSAVNFNVVVAIITSWTISPLLAIFASAGVYLFLDKLFKGIKPRNGTRELAVALACWNGYSFGANDVANATGVYLAVAATAPILSVVDVRIFLALYGAIFIVLGGVFLGEKVVETMAFKITRLDPIGSVSSYLITASSVWLFTTIPYILLGYGFPVSTTYISVGSIMGTGIAKYKSIKKGLNLKVVLTILLSWALTLPITASLSAGLYYGLTTLLRGV